ncbi:aminotransferase class I/II-fold pyridoxal phosphate-dependent enzyme [Domibacillus sp. DTU_2020_1001157_1_SI_ALB_TIR_016]|uniref:aminotransferase class I/II-fold pyridoxal phosphate-dependent enzyme n=1 Tax=Domibacillus sp. DTU_2020_1001157_1_SI_ALB_TIR_016 TaxID=3077789 RepID=UPI0028E223B3|nr:aminotransferase class I/II-fold pyridoxal phosphate-dependent enzyme [Domibacillus sp. DTU_2020_1001157_1_SI_ALB_TIR_016]WNS82261.1 aminotransferase class I/II-fold pyridoxal phosphate-dependent enzyme [Domibacillus sp. DTU_2020_1001157_1_SI_ALB_TIR_016]
MKNLFNKDVQSLGISGIIKMSEIIKTYDGVVALTIGEPDFQTPFLIKEAGKAAIDNNRTFYAPTAGEPALRRAVSSFMERRYHLSYNPDTEIIVTNGTTEAVFLTLKTLLSPGDEVILATPAYPGYEPVIKLCGGVLVPIDVSGTRFKLTKEQLEQAITPKTKAIILTFPSNPTGAILTKDELMDLAKVIEKHNVFVISDELYSELVFDQPHQSIASFPSIREKVIVINGVSKSHAMTGWRIGCTFAPSYITNELFKVHEYLNTSISSISQEAAAYALNHGEKEVEQMKFEYQKRRDYLCKRLNALGFDTIVPDGTFYAFPSITRFHHDSYAFSMELLEQAKVGLLPSTIFTKGGSDRLRISFAYSMEKLNEAMNRIEQYLKTNKKGI